MVRVPQKYFLYGFVLVSVVSHFIPPMMMMMLEFQRSCDSRCAYEAVIRILLLLLLYLLLLGRSASTTSSEVILMGGFVLKRTRVLIIYLFCVLVLVAMAVVHGNRRIQAVQSQKVCKYWRAGRCNRYPCPYLHTELPENSNNGTEPKSPHLKNVSASHTATGRKPNTHLNSNQQFSSKWVRDDGKGKKPNAHLNSNQQFSSKRVGGDEAGINAHINSTDQFLSKRVSGDTAGRKPNAHINSHDQFSSKCIGEDEAFKAPQKIQDKCCHNWMLGKCSYGDNCRYLHQWFVSDSFSLMTELSGHEKDVNAIVFPSGSDRLYSGSKDETLRAWDCNTGQCAAVVNLGGEVGSMISEGPWLFVGAPNLVKALNSQTNADLSLSGPVGQVYSLKVSKDMLLAGTQDGTILAWRISDSNNSIEPVASLKGHNLAVVSLIVGASNRLYSASMDHTIRVWDLETLQCIHVLTEHTDAVTSVLCWDQFLLSCSLDQTIKVWAATESESLEVIYTHNLEHGILLLCGVHDGANPILMCSCNDNTVRLHDLPSFKERGRIFSTKEIRAMEIFNGGLFFTGDGAGKVKVWKWSQ